jgi:polar amino acid transport system substrate-binding protein
MHCWHRNLSCHYASIHPHRGGKRGNIQNRDKIIAMLKLLLILCAICCCQARAATLQAYAEESAPYHFTEQGKVVGIAADLLRAACKEAKHDCNIRILPWARAYALTKDKPNALIFSIVRRPEREREFLWLSPIITEGMWLYASPDAPTIGRLADIKDARIGAINGGSAIAALRQRGVPKASIDPANSIEANLKKFAAGRVDYIVDTELRFGMELARYPLPFKARKMLKLQDATSYYAMNLHSDPAVVKSLRIALDKLRANKTLEQITRQYAPGE